MHEYLKVPRFADEAEEARWWFENQDRLAEDFDAAAAEGKLTRGRLTRKASLATGAMIELDPEDQARARSLAERKGLQYQTYLRDLIHQALENEERLAG